MGTPARIVVTGATGFIGSHMVARAKAEGHHVTGVDIQHAGLRREWYEHADNIEVRDLRQLDHCLQAVKHADWVFHFAADMGGVGYFFSDSDYPASVDNALIDLHMLKACRKAGVKRMFYASSACAYPIRDQRLNKVGLPEVALTEEMLGQGPAEQLYGEEKRFLALLADKAPFDARVGLFSTIYGPGQDWDGIRSKFPTSILRKAIEARRSGMPVVDVWGDGTQIRTFLWIDDAIERMWRVMTSPNYEGPVNIGSDEPVTIRECAEWACELVGIEPIFNWAQDKPTGVMAKHYDNSLFTDRYGPAPQKSMRHGFVLLHEWLESVLP